MTKLNDTQLVILSAASRRRDFSVYPLPRSVKRGDGPKLLKQMLTKQLIEEVEAVGDAPVWRQHEDGYGVTLVLADGGFKALGLARESTEAIAEAKSPKQKPDKQAKPNPGSKLEQLVTMLKSTEGASIEEIAKTLGWLPHTARAVLSVSIKRKLGLTPTKERVDGRGTIYRV